MKLDENQKKLIKIKQGCKLDYQWIDSCSFLISEGTDVEVAYKGELQECESWVKDNKKINTIGICHFTGTGDKGGNSISPNEIGYVALNQRESVQNPNSRYVFILENNVEHYLEYPDESKNKKSLKDSTYDTIQINKNIFGKQFLNTM